MTIELKKSDAEALQFVSEVLVQMRRIAQQPPTKENMATLAKFADAMHNIPEVIATGQSEQMSFLIQSGLDQGLKVWKAAVPERNPHSIPS